MNWVDWTILVMLLLSVIGGFKDGAARIVIGLIATLVGIFLGMWCYRIPAAHIVDYLKSSALADLAGFLLIFIACLIVGGVVGYFVSRFLKVTRLSWLDHFLGSLLGLVRGVVIAVAVITVLVAFEPNPPPESVTHSRLLPYFIDASSVLAVTTPRQLKESFREAEEQVKKAWEDHRKESAHPSKKAEA